MKNLLPTLVLAALALGGSACNDSTSTEKKAQGSQGATAASGATPAAPSSGAGKRQKFTLGVSIYVGWMPWYYAFEHGIVEKWAKHKGLEIEVKYYSDYISSVNAYVARQDDACVMTNMEALDMPCVAGVDSTALILGDFSNGNDAILVRDDLTLKGLAKQNVYLVELSVSHYLLARALESAGLKEADVTIVNTSDQTIGPAFITNPSQKAVVTWNPIVMQIESRPGVKKIFDSSSIPGEILDLCVVNTKTLTQNPALGEALVGIWFETLDLLSRPGPAADEAVAAMAKLSGCSPEEYRAQLRTTAMFWTAKEAVHYATGEELEKKMELVRRFCFAHGLLGPDAKSVDAVGIEYPGGKIQGDPKNVKLRWNTGFMEQVQMGVAAGK